ncbi:hypothetical protein FG167_05815 [Lacinutrix sp. WUR7]|uniref:hypothetical protein n=1 Tax=Lacinutrix sp. WUR7 TaxID=2653681 RepID=UPI00193D7886|nr:hypothetical protein [Lacinutrix sp. WUR7]QRM88769.1 hypothetical protein FG167_05815 [Lacinutrix sp. WUR7]
MSDKKHIDRIFQEKLKDLEVTPDAKVWENIQSQLEQPKEDKEKIFPIWFRIGGVAALLLVLLTVGNLYISNKNNTTKTKVVDIENATNPSAEEKNSTNKNSTNSENPNNAIVEESSKASKNEETIVDTKNISEENKNSTNTSIVSSSSSEKSINKNLNTSNSRYNNTSQNNKTVTVSKNKSKTSTNKQTPVIVAKNNAPLYTNSKGITPNYAPSRNPKKNAVANNSKDQNTNITNKNKNAIVQNRTENSNNTTENVTELDKNKVATELQNSTTNAITENTINTEVENTITDADPKKEEPSIEEEIAKIEDLTEKEEEKVNKWQVYANIAPVYYNTLSKGSHIDDQFIDNSKSGEVNTSYGVNVSYAFNNKLKLRSGVNSLNLSYDTDNVILIQSADGNNGGLALKNINFNNDQHISAISANNLVVQQAIGILPNTNAAISQRIGYYEVPMELEYTVSSKKFGVNVIAGLSTFILNDNKIFSEFEGRKTEIGEANNINNVSFSGNLGLGLDYKFSNKIKFNVQPTFKYQMNAFENTSGNFRPYIIGVYTGLSYKF